MDSTQNNTVAEAQKHVLVVEDDKFFTDLLAKKLSAAGYKMTYANTATDALTLLATIKPDIALFDILLPETDGFELYVKVKAMDNFKDLPIIFLSNMGTKEYLEKAKSLNSAGFLIKATVSLDQISKEIAAVLAKTK